MSEVESVIGEEFRRIETYYDKDKAYKKQQVKPTAKKKVEVEKNYIEWRPRESWLSTLRSDSAKKIESSTINTESSKERIRNSIRNIMSITEKKEKTSRVSTDGNNTNTIMSNEIISTENMWKGSNRSISSDNSKHVPQEIQKNIALQTKIKA